MKKERDRKKYARSLFTATSRNIGRIKSRALICHVHALHHLDVAKNMPRNQPDNGGQETGHASPFRSQLLSRLDLVTLRLFIAVVEEASIAKAAEREHLAPSAVSKRLADLELALGVPLLERHRRGVTLTSAGEALLSNSRRILRDLTRLESEMGEFTAETKGARGHICASASEAAKDNH
ncbi:LysR family transcriptional regulator [Paraburkholderia sp. SIMBA_027]|uniref:LysR family transcriptional regulator n=1 Tax=Paraburkholderia sp. SIMBA_027 TaxID=3085770 RepID=UPI003978B082